MKNNSFLLGLALMSIVCSQFLFAATAAAAEEASGETECQRNPPGLRASEMIGAGFVVHHLEDGSFAYVRLDYVYPDRLYFRYQGSTWRALYLAHPSQVIRKPRGDQPVICGYVVGFRIDQRDNESSKPTWVFVQDIDFVETP